MKQIYRVFIGYFPHIVTECADFQVEHNAIHPMMNLWKLSRSIGVVPVHARRVWCKISRVERAGCPSKSKTYF